MRTLAGLVCAFAIGCGGSSGGGGGGGTDGGGGSGGDMAVGSAVAVQGSVVGGGQGMTSSPPIAGATVTIVGTSTSTTTAADGSFSLMASGGASIFLSVTLANYQTSEAGFVVPAGGGTVPEITLLANAEVQGVTAVLNPPLTLDTSKGVVVVKFKDQTQTAGYGATLSASHGMSFDPQTQTYAMKTSGGQNDAALVFPNVVAGTTTVTASAPAGKTCTPAQAITNWRVDPNVFTWVVFDCQ